MDKPLKQRMVGAIVLIALAVIFIPMLLDGGNRESQRSVSLDIPAKPDQKYRSRLLPLDERQSNTKAEEDAAGESSGQVQRERQVADTPDSASGEAEVTPETAAGPEPQRPETPDEASGRDEVPERDAPEEVAAVADDGDGSGDRETESSKDPALANWFVQVGSFSREENARDLRDRLRQAGYTAFTETSTVDGTATHRVKVGPEMDRSRAERVRDEIARGFDLKGIVVSES